MYWQFGLSAAKDVKELSVFSDLVRKQSIKVKIAASLRLVTWQRTRGRINQTSKTKNGTLYPDLTSMGLETLNTRTPFEVRPSS